MTTLKRKLDATLSRWVRLGAMFGVGPCAEEPDLDELIVDSASVMQRMPRLHAVMVSWLIRYGELTCRHRLARMARQISSPLQSAALGFSLSYAKEHSRSDHFNLVLEACAPLKTPEPLFDVYRENGQLRQMAAQSSSLLAIRWGLWSPEERLSDDAIRPAKWIMNCNPSLQLRALFRGKLPASILATLQHTPEAGHSESALARALGVTRRATREALDHLELCQLAVRTRGKHTTRIELLPRPALGLE
ncbi:MAG: hypothetical protein HN909_06955 [Phycisphaerales bacterium]|jgi:hypothetical protein|nr:hypothetical protein [Phycisphaerales bacterium]MBT7171490.1 hypothetical protein [Phycisphaerales bacterium]